VKVPVTELSTKSFDLVEGYRQFAMNKKGLHLLSKEDQLRIQLAYNPFYEYAKAKLDEDEEGMKHAVLRVNELFRGLSKQNIPAKTLRDLFKDYTRDLDEDNKKAYAVLETKVDDIRQIKLEDAFATQRHALGIGPDGTRKNPAIHSLDVLEGLLDVEHPTNPFAKTLAPDVERLLDAYRMAYLDTPKTQDELDVLLQHPLYWTQTGRVMRRIKQLKQTLPKRLT
jgi:hypothetical protein